MAIRPDYDACGAVQPCQHFVQCALLRNTTDNLKGRRSPGISARPQNTAPERAMTRIGPPGHISGDGLALHLFSGSQSPAHLVMRMYGYAICVHVLLLEVKLTAVGCEVMVHRALSITSRDNAELAGRLGSCSSGLWF